MLISLSSELNYVCERYNKKGVEIRVVEHTKKIGIEFDCWLDG